MKFHTGDKVRFIQGQLRNWQQNETYGAKYDTTYIVRDRDDLTSYPLYSEAGEFVVCASEDQIESIDQAQPDTETNFSYRNEVLRTCNPDHTAVRVRLCADNNVKLLLGGLGLAGEAGEVADLVKKVIFHGNAFDRDKLVKELGDVRWYFELVCEATGITMDEVERTNADKLRKRFPTGFSEQAAQVRADLMKESA